MVRLNTVNAVILDRLPDLVGVAPQVHLVAGALFGTAWNVLSDKAPMAHIHDYDIPYWHPDTSYEAEDVVIRQAADLFRDVDARIEVRNQARVHLWFNPKHGLNRPALGSVREGIDQFLVECTWPGEVRRLRSGTGPLEYWLHEPHRHRSPRPRGGCRRRWVVGEAPRLSVAGRSHVRRADAGPRPGVDFGADLDSAGVGGCDGGGSDFGG